MKILNSFLWLKEAEKSSLQLQNSLEELKDSKEHMLTDLIETE